MIRGGSIQKILRNDGVFGLISACIRRFKKIYFTLWYRLRIGRVGSGTVFEGPIQLSGGRHITIGRNCVIESHVLIHAAEGARITIEDGCYIARAANLLTSGKMTILANSKILQYAVLQSNGNIQIGPKAWVARHCLLGGKDIRLQEGVILGPYTSIFTGNHAFDTDLGRVERHSAGDDLPVVLEAGCWVGARVVVLRGVTIGAGAVIGAGSVVTHDVGPRGVAVGVPAKEIKKSK